MFAPPTPSSATAVFTIPLHTSIKLYCGATSCISVVDARQISTNRWANRHYRDIRQIPNMHIAFHRITKKISFWATNNIFHLQNVPEIPEEWQIVDESLVPNYLKQGLVGWRIDLDPGPVTFCLWQRDGMIACPTSQACCINPCVPVAHMMYTLSPILLKKKCEKILFHCQVCTKHLSSIHCCKISI